MALFRPIRRMLSPREGRGHEETPPDTPVASSGARLSTGHSESVVENAIYSEPTPLDRVETQRHSHHRISSGEDPPLPPRPLSGGGAGGAQQNSEEHETYYQAPVDTLGRGVGLDPQAGTQQQRMTSIRERERAAVERERRRMDMHERTLNQIQGAGGYPVHLQGRVGGLGHRRTRSGGHIIDNEEYSTPWDVQGEQRRRASGHNPPKPARNRRPIPATPNDGSDNIIPISPTSILSAHERSQSVSPVPPRSPVQALGDAEYDDPWDVRNRNISQVIPSQRHHTHSDRRSPPSAGDHRPPMRQSVGSKTTEHPRPHLEEVRPSRSLSDRNHPRGVPTEPPEQFRPRTITDVHPPHSLSHSNPSSPRTSSMCAATHPIQRRPLPEEPPSGGTGATAAPISVSAPPSVSNSTRAEPSVLFESNLALEEQLWYHGAITRAEAETVLASKRDFSFLVRNSESCRTDYSLSIRDRSSGFIHLRIVYERSGYVLGQFSSHFQTVPECIFFYTQQRLNIRGTDHKKLRYPVPRDHYKP